MNRILLTGSLAALVLLAGCKSGQYRDEALRIQTINPHFSLEYAAKALESDPKDQKTIDATRAILGAIATDHRNRVKEMDASGDYEGAVVDCDRVLASAHFVKGFPGQFNLPYDEGERQEFAEKAADKCYKQGLAMEEQKQSREAFDAYCRCRSFRMNYKDIETRMAAIGDASVIRMFISSKIAIPGTETPVAQLATSLPQCTMALRPRSLKFFDTKDAATSAGEVSISDFNFNDSGWVSKRDKNEFQAKSKDQYGKERLLTYRADWTEYTRTVSCTMTAGYTLAAIRTGDPAGAGHSTQTATWEGKYVLWNGDKEAVPDGLKKLPNSQPATPGKEAMASECMKITIQELAGQLFQNYK